MTTTIVILPGFDVTDTMYDVAADGVATFAPDLGPLTREQFTNPTNWWMIPDDDGAGYKAELQLLNTIERTIRLNCWFLPDLRGGQESRPHSHPWHFQARVLAGGYTEDRYARTGNRVAGELPVRQQLGVEHEAGSRNEVPRSVYHEVTQIHEPGRTLSLMVCDRGERGAWGYLDTSTGLHTPTTPDPDFRAKLHALNPHQY